MHEIAIKTSKKREVIDITEDIEKSLDGNGICNIFVRHTTAAISTADFDPGGTKESYLDAFEELIPKLQFRHPHDPEHMPDHILSTLIGTSIPIPFKEGKLLLGTWQRIVFI